MSTRTNYNNFIYEDYEKMLKKLDNVLDELSELKTENKQLKKISEKGNYQLKLELKREFKKEKEELKETISSLTKQLEKANELIKKLQEENDRLKNQNNKNSSNSSKPSSTNIVTPKKKTGANLYNYRIKSDKKIGGQKGHQGHNLDKKKVENLINSGKLKVKVYHHKIRGNSNQQETIKYRLGLEITPYAEKHIFHYDENTTKSLPKEFYTDVTYNNSIKSLSIELGAYNVISYERLSDFFKVISQETIKISNGTLVNFLKEFSCKSLLSLNNLENNLLNDKNINTDETSSKYNKSLMYFRNYSNQETVIYKAHERKGHKPIKEDNILTRFTGGIMGDHDTTLYSYGTRNYECNIHVGRYLEELIQNISSISWAKSMKDLLFEIKKEREIFLKTSKSSFNEATTKNYENKYNEILETANKENENISSSFYKEKAKQLYRRLKKYKENHLAFMYDFEIGFDNNISERDLRVLKTKTKVSGGFRNISVAECYANALSIIKTSIKRNINPFNSILDIFNNEILFSESVNKSV